MKNKNRAVLKASKDVISMVEFKKGQRSENSDDIILRIQRDLKGMNDRINGMEVNETREDLIRRFKEQAMKPDSLQKSVLVETDEGKITSMSPDQAKRYREGILANVVSIKRGNS